MIRLATWRVLISSGLERVHTLSRRHFSRAPIARRTSFDRKKTTRYFELNDSHCIVGLRDSVGRTEYLTTKKRRKTGREKTGRNVSGISTRHQQWRPLWKIPTIKCPSDYFNFLSWFGLESCYRQLLSFHNEPTWLPCRAFLGPEKKSKGNNISKQE